MLSGFTKVLAALALCALTVVLYFGVHKNVLERSSEFISRRLSLSYDMTTHEYLRTTDGVVPEVSCPLGPSGSTLLVRVSGQRQDGCYPCPRGRYGSTVGLKTASCSGACPIGTYSDKVGLESVTDCQKCPVGTYGLYSGLTTAKCSGVCPAGTYSDQPGSSSCKKCPLHYHGWQCSTDITK